jgi:predicted kinase
MTASAAHLRKLCLPESLPGKAQPTVYAMCGIPASGKTTYTIAMQRKGIFPKDCYVMDPDRIELLLPEYGPTCAKLGQEEGHALLVGQAREAAYAMQDEAVSRRVDMIIDMGQALPEALSRLSTLKNEHGYRLEMIYLYCPVEEAERRAMLRGRAMEQDIIRPRYSALIDLLPHYHALADSFTALDNSDLSKPWQTLYTFENGELVAGEYIAPPPL